VANFDNFDHRQQFLLLLLLCGGSWATMWCSAAREWEGVYTRIRIAPSSKRSTAEWHLCSCICNLPVPGYAQKGSSLVQVRLRQQLLCTDCGGEAMTRWQAVTRNGRRARAKERASCRVPALPCSSVISFQPKGCGERHGRPLHGSSHQGDEWSSADCRCGCWIEE
jgi:hypothetical protein